MNREINTQQEKKYIAIKASPLVSIITLNWNQTGATCQFLEYTKKLTYKHFEVLVCDMGSTIDPGPQLFRGDYPHMRLLRADSTLRPEGAANWAVTQAKGDFILFMNNQTEVTENVIDDLLAPLLNDQAVGVACPKIYSHKNKNVIEYAGCTTVNRITGFSNIIGNKKKDKGQYDKEAYTNGVYSGAMMMRKTVIEKAGVLPRNFFVYFDDAEISARVLKNGYKILYQPKAVVYSKSSLANREETAMEVYYNTRNRILAMRNNTTVAGFSLFLLFFSIVFIPFNIIRYTTLRKFNHLQAFFKAIVWNIKKRKAKLAFYSNL
ncbi:MAG: glycosyltransferase family 2 protein [Chitinophagaceae bacterium]|nr:glycosyltransferase family 2 protein [Chitinophagaceae bacterium]